MKRCRSFAPVFFALACLIMAACARSGRCASGFHLPGAGSSAMGGISVVGGSWSPLRVAAFPSRGYELQASWANPYGIEELQMCAVAFRGCRDRAGVAASMQALSTPTPFSEVHFAASGSFAASRSVALGAGLDFASLMDSGEAFASEAAASVGLAAGRPGGWEAGFAVSTPISRGAAAKAAGGSAGGGYFRWGLALPLARSFSVLVEEERRGRDAVRRLGCEVAVAGGIALRAGIVDSPFTVTLGVGVARARTGLDLSVAQHEALGATPYVTVSYASSWAHDRAPGGVSTGESAPR